MTKTCAKCGETYPATIEFFYKKRGGKYGLRSWCKVCTGEYQKIYDFKNQEERRGYQKEYRLKPDNKELAQINIRRYRLENRERIRACSRHYSKYRLLSNPQFKAAHRIRQYTRHVLMKSYCKGKAVTLLGGTSEFVRSYLESKFYDHPMTKKPMNWGNHGRGEGKWNVDHIDDLSSFDLLNEGQYRLAGHWTNIQPLWFIDHIKKHKRG